MQLDEATFDDIMRELRSRYPGGVLLACAKPEDSEVKSDSVLDDDVTIGYCRMLPAMALARIATGLLEVRAQDKYEDRAVEEGSDEDEA